MWGYVIDKAPCTLAVVVYRWLVCKSRGNTKCKACLSYEWIDVDDNFEFVALFLELWSCFDTWINC